MASSYIATIPVAVWKEHTCARCGTPYRYLFQRTKKAKGRTPEAASEAARAAVLRALQSEVDMQPCPTCGAYQPDMIAARRSRRHWYLLGAAGALAVVAFFLGVADTVPPNVLCWVLAGGSGALLLAHLFVDALNPNRNLQANISLAGTRMRQDELWAPEEGTGAPAEVKHLGNGWGLLHLAGYTLLLAGVACAALPEVERLVAGWPLNIGCSPAVVGPGEETKLWFPDKVSSIKGMWSASPKVELLNATEVGLPAGTLLNATSNNESWGNSISVKSSEKNSSSTLWAKVRIPPDEGLAGKTLRLQVDLLVRWPQVQGKGFVSQEQPFRYATVLTLGPAGSGSTFHTHLWLGVMGSIVLALLGPVALALAAGSFRKKALPTRIFMSDRADEESPLDRVRRPSEGRYPSGDNDDRADRYRGR